VCDFEAFLVPVNNDDEDADDDDVRGMRLIDEHRVSGFCCYRVTKHEQYQTPPRVYSGDNVMETFYDHIMSESRIISAIVKDNVEMLPLKPEEEAEHEAASKRGNCDKALTTKNWKVHHHCHTSGNICLRHATTVIFSLNH